MADVKRKRWFGVVGCLLPLCILFGIAYSLLGPHKVLHDLSGADQEIVVHPDFVEVYRIEPVEYPDRLNRPGDVLANVKKISPGKKVSKNVAQSISGLIDGSIWSALSSPKSGPTPGILFRFHKGVRKVEILYCGMCGAFFMYPEGARKAHPRYGSNRKELLRIVQELFPDDADLQQGSVMRFEVPQARRTT